MTEITADLVRQLREMTSAPMMDCKRALQDGDRLELFDPLSSASHV